MIVSRVWINVLPYAKVNMVPQLSRWGVFHYYLYKICHMCNLEVELVPLFWVSDVLKKSSCKLFPPQKRWYAQPNYHLRIGYWIIDDIMRSLQI